MADIRCLLDLLPTINTGVVAKVVKAKKHVLDQSALQKSPAGEIPVMLETTAAVHPGGSGGAVVDSSGRLISLVTSFGFVWLMLVQKLFHLEGRRIILLLRLVDYLEKK